MGQKSIIWINNVRAIAIISVFFIHTQGYYGFCYEMLNSFVHPYYVNAFFFISGYLLFWKQLSKPRILEDRCIYMTSGGGKILLTNVFFRIIIPSILFSIIEFFPNCFIREREIDIKYALFKTIGGGTYWFTSALVFTELIIFLLFCSRIRKIWFYMSACLLIGIVGWLNVNYCFIDNDIWMWRQGLLALPFLAIGGLYRKYERQIDRYLMQRWFIILLLIVYMFMIIVLKEYCNPIVSTLDIQPLGYFTSATACLLLVWICKMLPEIKPLTFIGKNSIGFYFMSGALPIVLSIVAHQIMDTSYGWVMLTIWGICIVLAYFIVVLINHRLPWLWDLRLLRKQY